MIAGNLPTPNSGIINANKAREGIVCKALVKPITIVAAFGKRVSKTPSGTAMMIPMIKASPEI